jgi:hypothetical protein
MVCLMDLLERSFSRIRTWLGLGDPSDDQLIPGHGWLLRAPEVVLQEADEAVSPGRRRP